MHAFELLVSCPANSSQQSISPEVDCTHLVGSAVLDDLCAQVAALDGAEVLLVALAVAVVLVDHVGRAGLRLRLDDGVPQLLRLHCASPATLALVPVRNTSHCTTVRMRDVKVWLRPQHRK